MGRSDRITIILSVAALCATIIGSSCSTNARIDDLNGRFDHLNASVNARFDHLNASVNARFDDLNASVNARFDDLSASVNARIEALERDLRELRAIVIDALKGAAPAAD